MSYCRWSSDRFQCDVYVYEDVSGGWTTHVAGRRSTTLSPVMPWRWLSVPIIGRLMWAQYNRKNKKWSDNKVLVDIGLPHDGESENHSTPGECADYLLYLSGLGYKVPQYAIDALREEENELQG